MTDRDRSADLNRRLIAIVRELHGLNIDECEHLLTEVLRNVKTMISVDATGPSFGQMVEEIRERFGVQAPTRTRN